MSISKKTKTTSLKAIEIEELRHRLARIRNLSLLAETYKGNYPEIANDNSGEKWDILNKAKISEETYPMALDRIKLIANEIKGTGIKILDYGFGNGKFEELLWKRKFTINELQGIDISKKSVKRATKLFPEWKFVHGSQEKLKFKKNYFDFITIMEVLEHVNPSKVLNFLKKMFYILKKQGKLIVSVPLNEPLKEMINAGNNPNSHVRIYISELIISELKFAGFHVTKMKYLYAFHNFYRLKTFIVRHFPFTSVKPNNLILIAEKT